MWFSGVDVRVGIMSSYFLCVTCFLQNVELWPSFYTKLFGSLFYRQWIAGIDIRDFAVSIDVDQILVNVEL